VDKCYNTQKDKHIIFKDFGKKDVNLKNNQYKRELLGLGMNQEDSHTRITKGDNFCVHGGSDSTHSSMRSKIMRFNKLLQAQGTDLDAATDEQLHEVAVLAGFKCFKKITIEQD